MPLPAVRSRRVATLRCSVIDGRRYVFRSKTRGAVAVQNQDRKSTRLNSSHSQISYAVFCLKKKKNRRTMVLHRNYYNTTAHSRLVQHTSPTLTTLNPPCPLPRSRRYHQHVHLNTPDTTDET